MRSAARIFLVLMSATIVLTIVFNVGSLLSASAQEHVDRAISTSIDVQPDHLTATAGENWLSYHGDYSGRRFSSLAEITPANVSQLKAQWVFHVREDRKSTRLNSSH